MRRIEWLVAAAMLSAAAIAAHAQIPSAVEFRVPKPPTVALSDSGAFVAFELHVTNLTADTMTLRRVEVLDAEKGAVVASLADSVLLRAVGRAGAAIPAAATKDSIPQNVPGKLPKVDIVTVGGNFVGIDIGGGKYALYAHAQPGSLRVKVGDHVKRGQVIALLGNSGNSTEPHVHFQIADGPAFLSSEGVPYATDFDAIGNCAIGGNPPAIKCSRHAPTAVKGGIPLQNEVVRFPR